MGNKRFVKKKDENEIKINKIEPNWIKEFEFIKNEEKETIKENKNEWKIIKYKNRQRANHQTYIFNNIMIVIGKLYNI
jgi:hypothetical protein